MPYGLKYFSQYKSRDTTLYRVEIRDKALDDDLSALEVRMKSYPILRFADKENYSSLAGKTLSFSLWNTKAQDHFFYQDLFNGSETSMRVNFLEDGVLIFTGFIIPELYEDSYAPLPKAIRVQASDRISERVLNNYRILDDEDVGLTSMSSTIDTILGLTGTELDWTVATGWTATTEMTPPTNSVFDQGYLYFDSLRDNNDEFLRGGQMLIKILESFQCMVYQEIVDGQLRWLIDRIPERTGVNRRMYHYLLGSPAAPNSVNDLVPTPTRTILSGDRVLKTPLPSVTKTNGHKRISLRRDVMRFENLFNTRPLTLLFPTPEIPTGSIPSPPPRDWERHETIVRQRGGDFFGIFVYVADTNYSLIYNKAGDEEMDVLAATTWLTYEQDTDVLKLEIDTAWNRRRYYENFPGTNYTAVDRDTLFGVSVAIYDSGGAFVGYVVHQNHNDPASGYRLRPSQNEEAWIYKRWRYEAGLDYQDVENRKENHVWEIPLADVLTTTGDYRFVVGLIPHAMLEGNAWVMPRFDGLDQTFIEVHKCQMTTTAEDFPNDVWAELNSDYVSDKSWNVRWFTANYNYKNIIMNSQGKRFDEWIVEQDLGTFPSPSYLDYMVIDYYAQFYHQPRYRISQAVIRSATVPRINSQVTDPYTGIVYYIAGMSSDTMMGEHRVTLVELVNRDE